MSSQVMTSTIGTYLIQRLYELGVRHVFGVPGDFSLKFCQLLEGEHKIAFIGTTREDTAGFAADGYARRHNGLGVVLVTHGVGALSTVNPIAGANAESSPVLVISGAPGVQERRDHSMIHHSFGEKDAQRKIFENFTCAAASIQNVQNAARCIDEVIEQVWIQKKPGYLELPRDMIDCEIDPQSNHEPLCQYPSSDPATLKEALAESVALLKNARSPAILAGVQLHRYNVQNDLVRLAESARLPVAATIMGKTVFHERNPLYQGVYQGMVGSENARAVIEDSDLVLALGVMFTDINLGMYTAKLDINRMIQVNQGEVTIKHHKFPGITLKDYVLGLAAELRSMENRWSLRAESPDHNNGHGTDEANTLTTTGIIRLLNEKLTPDLAVICDTGDCLFAAAELQVPDKTAFFASAYYTTMGFAVPAALGVNCASPEVRPLILVGDGAFQMTGTELSTYKKLGLTPIVIVINNGGYETERVILDGEFNDIANWDYGAVCRMIQYGKSFQAGTYAEFQTALDTALADPEAMYVIDAVVTESSRGMRRLAEEIGRRIRKTS